MKSFKQYISEIRIARHKMPQVSTENLEDMLSWLSAKGIIVSRGTIDAKKLIPIQDVNFKSVQSIVTRKPEGALNKPILISYDNHLLDGHHRWKASVELGRKVKFIRVHLPALKALEAIKKYPNTEYRSKGTVPGSQHDAGLAK